MKVGDKVTFHGSPLQDIPAQSGEFVIAHFMPGGEKASDIFNQPMVVLENTEFGWIPAYTVKPL